MVFQIKWAEDAIIEDFIPIYGNSMEFTVPIVDKDTITLCENFTTCREILMYQAHLALLNKEMFSDYKMSMRDGYLLIMYNLGLKGTQKVMDTYCANALKIVHLFEEHFAWKQSVSFEDIDAYKEFDGSDFNKIRVFDPKKVRLLLVKCSSKWLKSPHMLSLLTLLLRLAMIKELASEKTIEQFKQTIRGMYKNPITASNRKQIKDITYYVKNEYKIWLLLENFDGLIGHAQFRGKYHWKPNIYSYNKRKEEPDTIMSEGIVTLCNGISRAQKLSALFGELCNKNNIPHKITNPKY